MLELHLRRDSLARNASQRLQGRCGVPTGAVCTQEAPQPEHITRAEQHWACFRSALVLHATQ